MKRKKTRHKAMSNARLKLCSILAADEQVETHAHNTPVDESLTCSYVLVL